MNIRYNFFNEVEMVTLCSKPLFIAEADTDDPYGESNLIAVISSGLVYSASIEQFGKKFFKNLLKVAAKFFWNLMSQPDFSWANFFPIGVLNRFPFFSNFYESEKHLLEHIEMTHSETWEFLNDRRALVSSKMQQLANVGTFLFHPEIRWGLFGRMLTADEFFMSAMALLRHIIAARFYSGKQVVSFDAFTSRPVIFTGSRYERRKKNVKLVKTNNLLVPKRD